MFRRKETKTMTTLKQKASDLIEEIMNEQLNVFIDNNGYVTSLDLKNQLRLSYPPFIWDQTPVSLWLSSNCKDSKYNIVDNGLYLTYTPIKKSKTKKKDNRIGKNEAVKQIQNTKGRFFSVTFMKKDDTPRKMTCKLVDGPDNLGYFKVKTVKGDFRQINTQTIQSFKINGELKKVRQ